LALTVTYSSKVRHVTERACGLVNAPHDQSELWRDESFFHAGEIQQSDLEFLASQVGWFEIAMAFN